MSDARETDGTKDIHADTISGVDNRRADSSTGVEFFQLIEGIIPYEQKFRRVPGKRVIGKMHGSLVDNLAVITIHAIPGNHLVYQTREGLVMDDFDRTAWSVTTAGTFRNDFTGYVGVFSQCSLPMVVTQIGLYKAHASMSGICNVASFNNIAGAGTIVNTAFDMSGVAVGEWKWQPITHLSVGTLAGLVMGLQITLGGFFWKDDTGNVITKISPVAAAQSIWSPDGVTWNAYQTDRSYVPLNYRYFVP